MKFRYRINQQRTYGTCLECDLPLYNPRAKRCPQHAKERELRLKRERGIRRRSRAGEGKYPEMQCAAATARFLYGR